VFDMLGLASFGHAVTLPKVKYMLVLGDGSETDSLNCSALLTRSLMNVDEVIYSSGFIIFMPLYQQ
jgi:hypothetical protein